MMPAQLITKAISRNRPTISEIVSGTTRVLCAVMPVVLTFTVIQSGRNHALPAHRTRIHPLEARHRVLAPATLDTSRTPKALVCYLIPAPAPASPASRATPTASASRAQLTSTAPAATPRPPPVRQTPPRPPAAMPSPPAPATRASRLQEQLPLMEELAFLVWRENTRTVQALQRAATVRQVRHLLLEVASWPAVNATQGIQVATEEHARLAQLERTRTPLALSHAPFAGRVHTAHPWRRCLWRRARRARRIPTPSPGAMI
jgi:hypothetical protein